jgi:hypothetical protein
MRENKPPRRAPLKLEQFRALAKGECAELTALVLSLRPLWRKMRRPGPLRDAPYFRLGSSFEGEPSSLRAYIKESRSMNPLMRRHFSGLYAKLLAALSDFLAAPVRFREDASLPGFQILESDPIFGKFGLPWHTDFDSVRLKWKRPLTRDGLRTFTLPISLPTSGATLDVKDIVYNGLIRHTPEFAAALERASVIARHPHKLGRILIQDGQRYHRIGMLRPPFIKGENRISLQGYAVRQGASWELHW